MALALTQKRLVVLGLARGRGRAGREGARGAIRAREGDRLKKRRWFSDAVAI
jgi:hypothetical protein